MNDPSANSNLSLEEVHALRQRLLELERSHQQCQQHVEQLTQQLAQEKAARHQAEERLHLTLSAAQVVAWDLDLVTHQVVCSPNAAAMWGIQVGSAEDFFAVIHPDDRPQIQQAAQRAIAGEMNYFQEYRVIRPDGAIRWISSRGQVYLDQSGQARRMIGLSVDVTDRKQTEAALREREEQLRVANERFQLAAKAVNCLIYDWYLDSDRIERTDGLTRLLGFSLEEAEPTGRWWCDRIHPEDLQPIRDRASLALQQTDYFSSEYRILNKENQYVHVLDQCLVVDRNTTGQPTRIVGSTMDIGERKRAELQLQESQRFIQQIANSMPGTLYVYDMIEQRNVYVNRQIGELLGYSPDQIQAFGDQLFATLMHPADIANLGVATERLNQAQDGDIVDHEYRMRHANGEWRWLWSRNTVSTRTPDGQAHQVVGTVHDITDRKQAETELQHREQELRVLVENTPDIIVRYDRALRHLYVNPSIERALGIAPAAFIGKTAQELGFNDAHWQPWYTAVQQVFATGQSHSLEYEFPNPAGEVRSYQAQFVPELMEGNHIATVLGFARDITAYKHTEASLRQSEERLRLAMEGAQMGTWDVDLQSGKAIWSEQHFTMLGFPPSSSGEASEEQWSSRIHPDDVERVIQAWQQARQDRTLYQAEYRVIRADTGEIAWLAGLGNFTYDQTGTAIRSIGVLFDISDRKQVEHDLRESEQRLQLAQQAGRIGTWEWNLQTNQVSWSEGLWTLLALEPNSITLNLETFSQFIHPDDREPALSGVEKALAQGDDYYSEFRVMRQDGTVCWLLSKGQVMRTSDGQPERLLGINVDITALKQAEAALAQSNQTLQAIIQACPLAIMGLQADGTVRIWNPAAERIFGWTQEEVLGQFLPAIPDDKRDEFLNNLALTLQGRGLVGVEAQRQKKGNIMFDVELWAAPVDEAQAGISCLSVVADITARKQTEAALHLSEARLHSFVTANIIGILFGDLEGGIQEANDEFLRIVGYTREELQNGTLRWVDITPPEYLPLDVEAIAEARRRGGCTPYEKEYIRKDGSRVPVLVGFGLVLVDREEAVAFILDLSDRKQAEAEREQLLKREQAAREQAEAANRIKDEFLAVLSHELRTPLNPILGWAKLLRTRQFDRQATDRALDTIERNAKLQAQLIEDLLDISRILQGKISLQASPVNLAIVIEAALETVRLSAEAKGIHIETQFAAEVGLVNGDANRLQQVVWNLLSNAVKFTPAGGHIIVQLDAGTLTTGSVQITVSDTGQGISSEFLPYVFEYFRQADSSTTRQFGGLGLGLAIVRHLVELHGGTVHAASPGLEQGATFTVQLPLMGTDLSADLTRLPTQAPKDLNDIDILVVDDEADMRDLIRFILEEQGAKVRVAASATEALQCFAQAMPDVLISDIGMPGMDGYALMRHLRATFAESPKLIPAIALTAYAGDINQQQALSAGFQVHLAKPIEPEELVKTVAQVIVQSLKPT